MNILFSSVSLYRFTSSCLGRVVFTTISWRRCGLKVRLLSNIYILYLSLNILHDLKSTFYILWMRVVGMEFGCTTFTICHYHMTYHARCITLLQFINSLERHHGMVNCLLDVHFRISPVVTWLLLAYCKFRHAVLLGLGSH